jgi:hypothetical protein
MDKKFEKALQIASHKHDVMALQIVDPTEMKMPNIGFVKFADAETGQEIWVNTANKATRDKFDIDRRSHQIFLKDIFAKCGVDHAQLRTDADYVRPLMNLFESR